MRSGQLGRHRVQILLTTFFFPSSSFFLFCFVLFAYLFCFFVLLFFSDVLKRNSSLAGFWIWQTCNIPSHGGQNMSQHYFNKSNNWFRKSLEGQIEVGVSCSLKPATDSNDTNPSLNDVIAMVLLEEVANFTKFFRSAFCYSFSANNGSYVCMNLTTNTALPWTILSPLLGRKVFSEF